MLVSLNASFSCACFTVVVDGNDDGNDDDGDGDCDGDDDNDDDEGNDKVEADGLEELSCEPTESIDVFELAALSEAALGC